MATRIKARAVRRAGNCSGRLSQQAVQGRTSNLVWATILGLKSVRDAGMSKHQQMQSTRIANVPQDQFDAQVDDDKPPTLAQQGINALDPKS